MLFLRDISSFMAANVGIFSELYKKFGKYCHYLYLCRLKMNKMDIDDNEYSFWMVRWARRFSRRD